MSGQYDSVIIVELQSQKNSFKNSGVELDKNLSIIRENRLMGDKKKERIDYDPSLYQSSKRLKFVAFSNFVNSATSKGIQSNLFQFRRFCSENYNFSFSLSDSTNYFSNTGIVISENLNEVEKILSSFVTSCKEGFSNSIENSSNKKIKALFNRDFFNLRRNAERHYSANEAIRKFSTIIDTSDATKTEKNNAIAQAKQNSYELALKRKELSGIISTNLDSMAKEIDKRIMSVKLGN